MTPRAATLLGLTAILMWSLLAALTVASGSVPAFQLAAMTFAVGAMVGFLTWIGRRNATRALRQSPLAWMVGVGGLFGYHALYFLALRLAPPAEAGLLNYLWPLLIVLFSALLPGESLRARHVAGALIGLAGLVVLFIGKGGGFSGLSPGYALAFAAAFVWAGYSVASRRFAHVPSGAVAGFCLATSLLAGALHLSTERTVWPQNPGQWAALALLGLGPAGAAFFLWDHGVKRGDIRLLGVLSYAAPVLSTLWLVAAGQAQAGWPLAVACAMIVAGAVVASGRRR